MEHFTLEKAYKENTLLRQSFNSLAQKTFGLDFENWYENGHWRNRYVPYSFCDNGKVIANVSVNVMEFLYQGKKQQFIQLGTVMTDEAYRKKGLIRKLMAEVEKDYGKIADGFFLFANDSVTEFYPKFGYEIAEEYQYTKEVNFAGKQWAQQIFMKTEKEWYLLDNAIAESICNGEFEMINNPGLILFYVTKFMQENVYYIKEWDAYVIAELEQEQLFIHTVIAKKSVAMDDIIKAFGNVKRVVLGFTPKNKEGYTLSKVCEEDTTLFVKGTFFENFNKKQLMFPTLSHA